ncbi:MAG: hypothetical protein JWL73_1053 [Actinomycetia bacterium]|nr:hypothetical protein [Actinomycetes bacterium]
MRCYRSPVTTEPDRISVTLDIDAPAVRVYALVADLTRMGEFSPESNGCTWLDGATKATPGARFSGRNRRGRRRWSTLGTVLVADPGVELSFEIHTVANLPVARWTYSIAPTRDGVACTVEEIWQDRRGPTIKVLGGLASGVWNRSDHNRNGMITTLERLKLAAERSHDPGNHEPDGAAPGA